MATHSSPLAWKIPWTEEPDRLQSMGSLRVGHDFTFTFTFHFHVLEREMATHSSVLAWRIPGTGQPGGLLSMGLHRIGHDWSNLAASAVLRLGLNTFWVYLCMMLNSVLNSFITYLHIQFSQHHFLKRLSFLHCIVLPPLSQINSPLVCDFISGLSIVFHWSILLFFFLVPY